MPRRICSSAAFTVADGECPVIAPVSPRQKSTYRKPSTSKNSAPCASRTNGGKAPAHLTIQFIGTPASNDLRARSNSAFDFGCSSTNFFCSRCIRDCRRERSIAFIVQKDKPQRTQRPPRNSSVHPCALCGEDSCYRM